MAAWFNLLMRRRIRIDTPIVVDGSRSTPLLAPGSYWVEIVGETVKIGAALDTTASSRMPVRQLFACLAQHHIVYLDW